MLTAQLIAGMSTEHLIAAAHAEQNPFTSTPLEIELLKRLEAATKPEFEDIREVVEEFEVDASALRRVCVATIMFSCLDDSAEILDILSAAGITNTEALETTIKQAAKFKSAAEITRDAIEKLNQITTTEQE